MKAEAERLRLKEFEAKLNWFCSRPAELPNEFVRQEVDELKSEVILMRKFSETSRMNQFSAGAEFMLRHFLQHGTVPLEYLSSYFVPCFKFQSKDKAVPRKSSLYPQIRNGRQKCSDPI